MTQLKTNFIFANYFKIFKRMNLIDQIKTTAKLANKTIVLPEGEEERTLKAANIIVKEGFAKIVLLGNKETIESKAKE